MEKDQLVLADVARHRVGAVRCARMTKGRQRDAAGLLNKFLRTDDLYRASSSAYGDLGPSALKRALRMFLRHPEHGFVWLAYVGERPVGVCVVCYAISTSIGGRVVKLDDVFVVRRWQRRGVATAMLEALIVELRRARVRRIDTAVHIGNRAAEKYYGSLGFRSLGEKRLALVL